MKMTQEEIVTRKQQILLLRGYFTLFVEHFIKTFSKKTFECQFFYLFIGKIPKKYENKYRTGNKMHVGFSGSNSIGSYTKMCFRDFTSVNFLNSLIIMCHEFGHIIDFYTKYKGDILYSNISSRRATENDIIKEEIRAWKLGLKLYKKFVNPLNLDRWYYIRKKCLNSYYNSTRGYSKKEKESNFGEFKNFINAINFEDYSWNMNYYKGMIEDMKQLKEL